MSSSGPARRILRVAGGEVRFAGVCFRYREDAPALEGIDLVVPGAAQTTALVGRSGSGKSTLLSLVPRLYDVTGGAVAIDGQDVRDVTLREPAQRRSRWSARTSCCSTTPCAPISRFGRPARREDADRGRGEGGSRARLHHGACRKATTPWSARAAGASPAASASASRSPAPSCKDAPILLLDEATSALDSESERLVQDAIRAADARPHDARHRPPALDRARRRPDRRHGGGPRRRDRHARRADRPRRHLCAAAPAAARPATSRAALLPPHEPVAMRSDQKRGRKSRSSASGS